MPQLLVTMATTKQGLSQGSLGIWGGQEPPPYPFIQHLLPCQEREPVSPPWMANLQVHPTGAKSMREHVFFSRTSLCVDVVLFFFLSLSSPNEKKMTYLFIYGCAGCSFAVRGLSLVAVGRGFSLAMVQASHHRGFSCCKTQALEHGISSFGSRA